MKLRSISMAEDITIQGSKEGLGSVVSIFAYFMEWYVLGHSGWQESVKCVKVVVKAT